MYIKIKVMLNVFFDIFKDNFVNFYIIEVEIFKIKCKF